MYVTLRKAGVIVYIFRIQNSDFWVQQRRTLLFLTLPNKTNTGLQQICNKRKSITVCDMITKRAEKW